MGGTLAGLLDQRAHVVAGHVEQALETLRLLVGVDVDPLRVLDQLPLQRLGIVDVDDACGKGKQFCKLCGAEAPCACDDLTTLRVGTDGDGLDEAVGADGLGEFAQLAGIEGAAGIGGGLVDGVDGDVLEFAAVLHGRAPWSVG